MCSWWFYLLKYTFLAPNTLLKNPNIANVQLVVLFGEVYFSSTNIEQKICKFLQTYTIFAIATLLLYCLNVASSKQSEVEYIKT